MQNPEMARLCASIEQLENNQRKNREENHLFRVMVLEKFDKMSGMLAANTEKMTIVTAVWLVLKTAFAAGISIIGAMIAYKGLK